MTDDEDHPEMQAVAKALFEQAAVLANMGGMNQRTMEAIQELCDDARIKAKARGLDFPECVVFWMEQARQVRIFRRDATDQLINTYIVNLIKELPGVDVGDLVAGIVRAFPHYRPGNVFTRIGKDSTDGGLH